MNFLSFILLLCAISQNLVYAMTPPCNPQMRKSYSHGYLDDKFYGSFDYENFPSCFNPQLSQPVRVVVADIPPFIPRATLIIPVMQTETLVVQAESLQEVSVTEFDQYYENHDYDVPSMMFAYRRHNRFVPDRQSIHCNECEVKCAVTAVLCLLGLGCVAIGR